MLGAVNKARDFLTMNVFRFSTRLWLASFYVKYNVMRAVFPLAGYNKPEFERSFKLERQDKLINGKQFDAMIVLDACRYDVFSEIVEDYIDGHLRPVISPASVTIDWLKRTFLGGKWRDTVYVSAAPHINKRGLLRDFDAGSVFLDVIEVWDWGWDEEFDMVPPSKVNLGVRIAMARMKLRGLGFPKDYKLIIHYEQPHAPYIAFKGFTAKVSKHEELSKNLASLAIRKSNPFTGKFSMEDITLGMLKDYLRSEEKIRRVLYHAYKENLRWVLKYVAELVPNLEGRIIITSDHGELFGEYGLYYHMDLPLQQLRIVPWFTVK